MEKEIRKVFYEKTAKEVAERLQQRDEDLMIPHKCEAAYICPNAGVDLDAIAPFTEEFGEIVDKMEEDLMNEKRVLEGTLDPIYDPSTENELSDSTLTEEQWKKPSPFGCLTIDLTHTSIPESSSLFDTADLFTRRCQRVQLSAPSSPLSLESCSGKSEDCGCETETMNECSECTVPMISDPMPGTQSEAKWSPPLKSTESLEQNLPDATL